MPRARDEMDAGGAVQRSFGTGRLPRDTDEARRENRNARGGKDGMEVRLEIGASSAVQQRRRGDYDSNSDEDSRRHSQKE